MLKKQLNVEITIFVFPSSLFNLLQGSTNSKIKRA